jgi:methionyl-tRNA synthetase
VSRSSYYITTPIYYVTDAPHIGHLYSTVAVDIMARYQRLQGKDVWFLTGTDEHGQKIQKKAKESGETPQGLADRVVLRYLDAWKVYGITYDDFIRTTEPRHKKVVQEYVQQLMQSGDIYLGTYEGWYCVPDETYWTESQVVDGKCPDCGRPVERLQEESYFFRMSAYQEKLLQHIEKHPDFIIPDSRKNEVLGFIRQGLKDISISRTTIQWGIPMPADPKATKEHKIYVWFDALTNYLSALGPLDSDEKYKRFWPAIHVVGKDILRFHAVYWPTFLMALGIPVPKQIVAHGWLTDSNRKISKSLGNMVDPISLAKEVGVDGVRYFLFREFVFGLDGEYTKEVVYQRINADLANDYGNCVNRLAAMIQKYLGDAQLNGTDAIAAPSELRKIAEEIVPAFHREMAGFGYQRALEQVWKLVSGVNRFIENTAPWALAKSKDPADQARLRAALIQCRESLRVVSLLAHAFIPTATARALQFLDDISLTQTRPLDFAAWGKGSSTFRVTKGEPLFPRLEWKPPSNT